MSEQIPNGHALMDQRAEAAIADANARQEQEMINMHTEANAMNAQIDQGQQMADQISAIDARRNTIVDPNKPAERSVLELNEEAHAAVFGPGGRVDQIKDEAGIADMRVNPVHGTKELPRNELADHQEKENNEKADDYITDFEQLREKEDFEPTQAKLILDLREERLAKEQSLFTKLRGLNGERTAVNHDDNHDVEGDAPQFTPAEAQGDAAKRVLEQTAKQGNDEDFTKQLIRSEGIMSREEYNRFRYKHGNPDKGERKEFTAYLDAYNNANRAKQDQKSREEIQAKLDAKALAHDQVIQAEFVGRFDPDDDNGATNDDGGDNGVGGEAPGPEGDNNEDRSLEALAVNRSRTRAGENNGRRTVRERLKSRKAKIVAGIAALAIVGGGVGLALSHDNDNDRAPNGAEIVKKVEQDNSIKQTGNKKNNNRSAETKESAGTVVLQSGENPWTESEQRLHALGIANPTDAQIQHYDERMAEMNEAYDYEGTSSENLPVGTELNLPR